MKITNFRGELTDISAKKEALIGHLDLCNDMFVEPNLGCASASSI